MGTSCREGKYAVLSGSSSAKLIFNYYWLLKMNIYKDLYRKSNNMSSDSASLFVNYHQFNPHKLQMKTPIHQRINQKNGM